MELFRFVIGRTGCAQSINPSVDSAFGISRLAKSDSISSRASAWCSQFRISERREEVDAFMSIGIGCGVSQSGNVKGLAGLGRPVCVLRAQC